MKSAEEQKKTYTDMLITSFHSLSFICFVRVGLKDGDKKLEEAVKPQ